MVLGKLDSYIQENKTRPLSYTKVSSNVIKGLTVRPEAIKILEENIGSQLFDIGLHNIVWICLLRQGQ